MGGLAPASFNSANFCKPGVLQTSALSEGWQKWVFEKTISGLHPTSSSWTALLPASCPGRVTWPALTTWDNPLALLQASSSRANLGNPESLSGKLFLFPKTKQIRFLLFPFLAQNTQFFLPRQLLTACCSRFSVRAKSPSCWQTAPTRHQVAINF